MAETLFTSPPNNLETFKIIIYNPKNIFFDPLKKNMFFIKKKHGKKKFNDGVVRVKIKDAKKSVFLTVFFFCKKNIVFFTKKNTKKTTLKKTIPTLIATRVAKKTCFFIVFFFNKKHVFLLFFFLMGRKKCSWDYI